MEKHHSKEEIPRHNHKEKQKKSGGKHLDQNRASNSSKDHNRMVPKKTENSKKDVLDTGDKQRTKKKIKGFNKKNKISIDHLLDFQSYEDLEEYQHKRSHGHRSKAKYNSGRKYSDTHNKLQLQGMSFINVNYKFVVDYRYNCMPQKLDPNVPIDLKHILQIIVPKGNTCPICLSDDPVAPRMICSCGHILCLTCLISLLESDIPTFNKKDEYTIPQKYRECPLCFSVIREKEIKPVIIENIDERFEIPKINDEVILTLMSRYQDSVISLPKNLQRHDDDFPMIDENSSYHQYLRIFRGGLEHILDMYDTDRRNILETFRNDSEDYDEDSKYVAKALKNIETDVDNWTNYFSQTILERSHVLQVDDSTSHSSGLFYYYQTGFNTSTKYVLSPLDIKILKTNYENDYTKLPSTIIAKVENIKYEDLTEEAATKKYKYLAHYPLGTSLGFLECDWSKSNYIDEGTWNNFKDDLTKRSRNSARKLKREDREKQRALINEEKRTRNFFENENNGVLGYQSEDEVARHFGSLSIIDNRNLPPLSSDSSRNVEDALEALTDLQTTIWGTKIPKPESEDSDSNDEWGTQELLRKAREEIENSKNNEGNAKGKKKKKKLVLLSSNSSW